MRLETCPEVPWAATHPSACLGVPKKHFWSSDFDQIEPTWHLNSGVTQEVATEVRCYVAAPRVLLEGLYFTTYSHMQYLIKPVL